MPDKEKAYAILVDYKTNTIYFPIKRKFDKYKNDGSLNYCGEMPQFFGGNKERYENDWDTIAREMREESDCIINIKLEKADLTLVHNYNSVERRDRNKSTFYDTYNFYIVDVEKFSLGSELRAADEVHLQNKEMLCIRSYFFGSNERSVEDMLFSVVGRNFKKYSEYNKFMASETYKAFGKVFKLVPKELSKIAGTANKTANNLIFSKELGSSKEPVLLNGMKVIFDEEVPVQPVTLRDTNDSKPAEERSPEPPRSAGNRYQDHPRYTTDRPDPLLRYRRPKKINL
jgi:hypothetical protein